MALTPEIQKLLDALHTTPREEGWAENVSEAYNGALDSLDVVMPDAAPDHIRMVENDVLQELLRQHVDADILEPVMELFDLPPTEEFEAKLSESAATWPDTVQVYSEEEFDVGGLRPNTNGNDIDASVTGKMIEAAREGNTAEIVQLLLVLNQKDLDSEYVPVNAPGEDVPGSMTEVGKTLYDYVQEKLFIANGEIGDTALTDKYDDAGNFIGVVNNRPYDPDGDGNAFREGVAASLTPEEMKAVIETAIFEDIKNGTFPIEGLQPTDAGRIAQTLYDNAFKQATRTGVDVGGSAPGTILNYSFDVSKSQLSAAIDNLFLGETPVLQSTAETFLNEHQFAEEYAKVLDALGGSMNADHLIEHFTNLMTDRMDNSVDPPEPIPKTLNIPEQIHEQFFDAIREAYDASRRKDPDDPDSPKTSFFDADVFGKVMEDRFGQIDAEHVVAPMNRDALDYSAAMKVSLGAETENGFQVVNEAGEVVFEISVEQGFELYAARNVGDSLAMNAMRGVETKEQLRELLGDGEFTVRAVSVLDSDLKTDDNALSGYYLASTETGNSFHVGFDAIPEATVSPAFKEHRDTSFDTRNAEPSINVNSELVIGEAAPEEAEVPVEPTNNEGPPPIGPPGTGPF